MTQNSALAEPVDLAELERDPYPIFDRLRDEAPVLWIPELSAWILTRWRECHLALTNTELFAPAPSDELAERVTGGITIVSMDGEQHADYREAVVPPLRPRALTDFVDDMVRPVARKRAQALAGAVEAELMASYFEPISVRALGDVLGLHDVSDDQLRSWFFGMVSGLTNSSMTEEGFAVSDRVAREITQAVTPLIERVTSEPDESVLSHLVHGGRAPDNPRTIDELLPTLLIYITGGMQEPGHGAGSTLLGLLSNPDQLARVIAEPKLIPRAINEGLRWISPLGHASRQARTDTELDGVPIAAGDKLLVVVSAANRDPERFEHADEFDIDRPSPNHLAFGGGTHVCPGHYFGRAIGRIALEELFTAFPGIELDPAHAPLVGGWHFRAPRELRVRLG